MTEQNDKSGLSCSFPFVDAIGVAVLVLMYVAMHEAGVVC